MGMTVNTVFPALRRLRYIVQSSKSVWTTDVVQMYMNMYMNSKMLGTWL